jgi:CRP-like cAMP-binding protein
MFSGVSDEEIYSILRVPIRYRTSKNIQTLMSLTENVSFFKKITEEYNSSIVHEKCCETMTLEEYSENDIIINFGELGEKFYIIFKGSLSVMIPTTQRIKVKLSEADSYQIYPNSSNQVIKKPTSSNNSSSIQSSDSDSESEDLDAIKLPDKRERREGIPVASVSEILKTLQFERKSLLKKKLDSDEHIMASLFKDKFKKEKKEIVKVIRQSDNEYIEIEISKLELVNTLKQGGSFGELALLSDRPRAATVVANERVALLVIHKYQFKRVLGNIANDRVMGKVKFLQSLSFFTSWTKSAISKISAYFEFLTFQRNQVIFAEGQEAKEVFFIKSGEFLITKQQKVSQVSNYFLKNRKTVFRSRELRLFLKGKGEIIGAYEVLNGMDFRIFTCICNTSNSEVFMIRKENLVNRIPYFEAIREALGKENERIDERLKELTEHDMYQEVYERPKNRSPSPFRHTKDIFTTADSSFPRSFNGTKISPRKVVKALSRKITKGDIQRALSPRKLKIEIKPKAFKPFQMRKSPPPNFMLKSRENSKIQGITKRMTDKLWNKETSILF